MGRDRLHIQMLWQSFKTGDDKAQEPLESYAYGATNAAQRQALQQQAFDQSPRFIRDEVLLEAVDKLAPTIEAEMILFAVMNVTILLVCGRLTLWADLSDDHDCVLTSAG